MPGSKAATAMQMSKLVFAGVAKLGRCGTWRLTSRCNGNADTQHSAVVYCPTRGRFGAGSRGCYTLAGCLNPPELTARTFLALARALLAVPNQAYRIAKAR
jgi:hypothetical protein